MYIVMVFTEACVKGWFVYTADKDKLPDSPWCVVLGTSSS